MTTIALAWINAKYDMDYDLLFIATFLMDMEIFSAMLQSFSC